MILAAIGDIHGNLPALEAVLHAIDEEGIQTLVNTGDCVFGHPWPNEVVERLRSRSVATVQGEADRRIVRFGRKRESLRARCTAEEFRALEETYGLCRSANLEYLRELPRRMTLSVDGIAVALCHGTLTSQDDQLDANDEQMRFQRQREIADATIVVCGKTHHGFVRSVEDTLFVNPGSVGMHPEGLARACYALISTEKDPWSAKLRWVDYDPAEA